MKNDDIYHKKKVQEERNFKKTLEDRLREEKVQMELQKGSKKNKLE